MVIRVDAWSPRARVQDAISAAFREMAHVHRLMSFHAIDSDVSRLNREAHRQVVAVDSCTYQVIEAALDLSHRSAGVFDIALASEWVAAGLLPVPSGACQPHAEANYRDIELHHSGIYFRRPLWLDLGGIAKGYAADRAVAVLRAHGVSQACVDAGGDLATLGAGPHKAALDDGRASAEMLAVIEIGEGAVATSCNRESVLSRNAMPSSAHWDALEHRAIDRTCAATVVAAKALYADALTKVVMVLGDESASLLRQYDACAYMSAGDEGWRAVGHR